MQNLQFSTIGQRLKSETFHAHLCCACFRCATILKQCAAHETYQCSHLKRGLAPPRTWGRATLYIKSFFTFTFCTTQLPQSPPYRPFKLRYKSKYTDCSDWSLNHHSLPHSKHPKRQTSIRIKTQSPQGKEFSRLHVFFSRLM